jgi:hypothetical protein
MLLLLQRGLSLPAINRTNRDDSGLLRGHFARRLFPAALGSEQQITIPI